ncbi:hypothetical protein CY34DRAFT_16464 [Suillus luteus UH-Slu-Lm8-n1]|uniref:Uncharacterized protein n=1 Tax=Suillus luteus UH-Slu-Lm8-n1 TaxID=930992 RepID=A0A0D0ADU8_9AGAM|nr:hypothetical protein CY34DRAFT_16464 [Suillus luteus UH-Slu-Lm8-n1]
MSFRIGYLYSPPTHADGPVILDWISRSRLTPDAINHSFFKVAYVLPAFAQTLGAEIIYESVYMDMATSQQLKLSPTQLPIPTGWRTLYICTDDDFVTRPVLQKITQAETEGSIFPSDAGTSQLDGEEFLTALNDWVDSNPSAFGTSSACSLGHQISSSAPSPAGTQLLAQVPAEGAPSPYHAAPRTGFVTFLLTPFLNVASVNSQAFDASLLTLHYVPCTPAIFSKGIKYEDRFIQKYFPLAYICIQDARVMAKNYLTASGLDRESFIAYCTTAVQEMLTVAHSAGQPAESGLKCCETGATKALDLTHADALKLVISQRDRLKKSLKDNTLPLVDSRDRIYMEGFALDSMKAGEVLSYISSVTGLTAWNGEVTSVAFTSDESGNNLYRRKAILTLLANRILKPIKDHSSKLSLAVLFPEHYESIPEHFLATACAMIVIRFRLRFPDHQIPKITGYILQKETYSQLILLRKARKANPQLHQWMNTRHGPYGWQKELLSGFY